MSAKQTAHQAYNEALGLLEPDDFFPALEQTYCIQNEKDVPKDRLTQGKWKEWIGNASKRERRAWVMDAYNFAAWLIEHKAEKKVGTDKKFTLTMPSGFEELSLVIVFIVGDDDRLDKDGILVSETNAGVSNSPYPMLALGSILSAFSTKDGPTFDEAVKGAWAAWSLYQEEYLEMHPDAKNPFGASVEAWVTQPLKIESTRERDHKLPVWIARFPRGNFDVDLFSDGDVGELREFANNQVLPKLQMVLPGFERKSVIRDPNKLVLANVDGVAKKTRAGAVSPELRIFVEAIMSVPANERMARVKIKLDELIARLYPGPEPFHWTNQSPRLLTAIRNMDRLTVPFINSSGNIQHGYAPVKLNTMNFQRRNDDVIFSVTLPDSVSGGPIFEKRFVRLLGKSAPKWHAYLTLCDLFHRYGVKKGKDGKFNIYDPTKPVEKRNADGHLLDAQGEVIRSDNGRPLKNPYSTAALSQLDREPNQKGIDQYPIVSFDDMLKACFPGRVVARCMRKVGYIFA